MNVGGEVAVRKGEQYGVQNAATDTSASVAATVLNASVLLVAPFLIRCTSVCIIR